MNLVRDTVTSHNLCHPGMTVLVAVSGGQDSVALLHVLHALRAEMDFQIAVGHVHHGLRHEEADKDQEFVTELCAQLQVPLHIEHRDASRCAEETGQSLEAAARMVRQEALNTIAQHVGAHRIALGHTANDRAETVLLNILRGSGIEGLAALKPRQGNIIRPLIRATRSMTGAFCRQLGIATRYDSSNRDLRFQRNRLRHEVLPYLAAHFNPSVALTLVRLSELAEEDAALLQALTEEQYAHLVQSRGHCCVSVSVDQMTSLPLAFQRRLLRRMVAQVAGHVMDLTQDVVEAVLSHTRQEPRRKASWTLPDGRTRVTVSDRIEVAGYRAVPVAQERELPLADSTVCLNDNTLVHLRVITLHELPRTIEPHRVFIPIASLAPPLRVGPRRPGDRVRPIGLGGSRKLSDCFVDRKVPRHLRDAVPVFRDATGILWVPGVVADERVRLVQTPCACLEIAVETQCESVPSYSVCHT